MGETSYHDQINYEFRKAASAIAQGFPDKKVEAVNAITKLWEEALAAQIVYYLSGAASDLAFAPDYESEETNADGLTDYDVVSDAMHGWAEGVAFLRGFYKVEGTMISDSDVVSLLEKANGSTSSLGNPLDLINNTTELGDVTAAAEELASIYGISVATALK